jgi:hypothetical protein
MDRVKPLKLESPDTGGVENDEFPTSMDPTEDFVECAGIVIDDATHVDESTVIARSNKDMIFKDGFNPAFVTLTQLLEGVAARDNRYLIFKIDGGTVYTTAGDVVEKATDP